MKKEIARCRKCNKKPTQKLIPLITNYNIATIIFCKNKKCDSNINGVGLTKSQAIDDWNQKVR